MTDWSVYLLTLSGVILGQLAPGPNLLAVASVALGSGYRAAAATAIGVALVVFVWVAFAALGLSALIAVAPRLMDLMMLVGGLYLLFLAGRAFRGAVSPRHALGHTATVTAAAAFRRGVCINATNPKSAMMWAAVGTFMVGAGLSPGEVLGFAPLGALSALAVYTAYAFLFSRGIARRAFACASRTFEAAFGVAFGFLGATLLVDGLKRLSR